MRMIDKINISSIIKDHAHTICSLDAAYKSEKFFFFGAPILIAVCAIFSPLTEGIAQIIATITSIFSGLLLNVQILVCDMRFKLAEKRRIVLKKLDEQAREDRSTSSDKEIPSDREREKIETLEKLASELYSNISFYLVLTIITLILLFIWYIFSNIKMVCFITPYSRSIVACITSSIIYYLLSLFFLSLLMVAKRTYALVKNGVMMAEEL